MFVALGERRMLTTFGQVDEKRVQTTFALLKLIFDFFYFALLFVLPIKVKFASIFGEILVVVARELDSLK